MNISDCPNLPYHSFNQLKEDYFSNAIGFIFQPSTAVKYELANPQSGLLNTISYLIILGYLIFIIVMHAWVWLLSVILFLVIHILVNPVAPTRVAVITTIIVAVLMSYSFLNEITNLFVLSMCLVLYIISMRLSLYFTRVAFIRHALSEEAIFSHLWINHQIGMCKDNKRYYALSSDV